jgi:hypothetical protein
MGAFDSVRVPYDSGYPTVGFGSDTTTKHFYNQSSFSFYDGFGLAELTKLLADADAHGYDTLWVPSEYKGRQTVGLKTWYVRALIKEHFGVEE